MIAIFMAASPRVFLQLADLQFGARDPAGRALSRRAAGVRRHGRRDRSLVPGDDGIFRLDVRARRARGLQPVPRHRRRARRPAWRSARCVGALVVTAGLSSLIATLGMNFMLRGFIMIVTQGKSIALLELQDTTARRAVLKRGLRRSGADLLGARLRRVRRRCCSTATGSARGCRRSATIPTARARWASTSRACASRPSSSWASARRSPGVFSTHGQLHLVADDRRRLSPARDRLGVRRRHADLGRRRHDRRRRDRRADRLVHPERHRRGGPQRLLRPVLQRPDHHSALLGHRWNQKRYR